MIETLQLIANVSMLVFVLASMASFGLGLSLGRIVAPLRNLRRVVMAILVNFAVVPAIAWLLTRFISIDRAFADGLLLLGAAAGAPFLPKLVDLARGDVPFSIALMLLQVVVSTLFMPLALPVLIPGLRTDAWSIARPMLLTILLPMVVAVAFRSRFERASTLLLPVVSIISNISMIVVTLLIIGLNLKALAGTVGSGAIGVALVFILLSLGAGYVLGGNTPEMRRTNGLGAAQRNIAAALVVGAGSFNDPKVTVMLIVATLVGVVVLVLSAVRFRRSGGVSAASEAL